MKNDVGVYCVGTRTQNLHYESDGSCTVYIQKTAPECATNWLPVGEEPFYCILRLYTPQASVLTDIWTPPALIKKMK